MRLLHKNVIPSGGHSDGHRAAWLQREGADMGGVTPLLTPVQVAIAGGSDFISRERWKNEQAHNRERPTIGEIVRVGISETDTGEKVITLRAVDGREVSLWLQGQNVRSITNY